LNDVLNSAKKALARNGRHDDIDQARRRFRQVMEADFRTALERLTGRRVGAFLGAIQLEPDVAAEIFVPDPAV
jgi:hypothetical protein